MWTGAGVYKSTCYTYGSVLSGKVARQHCSVCVNWSPACWQSGVWLEGVFVCSSLTPVHSNAYALQHS